MKFTNKLTSLILCLMLIFAMALTGCTNATAGNDQTAEAQNDSITVLGEGQTKILFTVVDKDGNETAFEIHTDKETVGDALLEHQLIQGEESEYGLYVKVVNGITADYDVDGTYWAFYINGE